MYFFMAKHLTSSESSIAEGYKVVKADQDVAAENAVPDAPNRARAKATACKAAVTFDPTQPPQQLLLRFRTPNKTPLRSVKINGVPATPADPKRGDVDITGLKGTTTVEVEF